MTEYILGLIPDYGLYVVFTCVFFACLAMPLPSSVLVLAAGGFAATDDLVLEQVLFVTFFAFVLGDQVAFQIARKLGQPLLLRFRKNKRMGKIVDRSEALVSKHGLSAVLISHTVLSPTAPYVSYVCGANAMRWRPFSLVASSGASIWTLSMVFIGYFFSSRLSQLSDILVSVVLVIAALSLAVVLIKWLKFKWKEL